MGNQYETTLLGSFHVYETLDWRSLQKAESDSSSLWNCRILLCPPPHDELLSKQTNKQQKDVLCWLIYNIVEFCDVFDSCLGCQPKVLSFGRFHAVLWNTQELRVSNYKLFSFIVFPAFQWYVSKDGGEPSRAAGWEWMEDVKVKWGVIWCNLWI